MQKIKTKDIKNLKKYSKERDDIRKYILGVKAPRRVILGPYLNFLFENRDTMLYQIQEMIYTEGITNKKGTQHEVDTYNKMIPEAYELKATLLIELDNSEVRKVKLSELVGLEKEIYLLIDGKHKVTVAYDKEQIGEAKLSSVQFLTFHLGEKIAQDFLKTNSVEIMTSHPACSYRAALSEEQLAALKSDMTDLKKSGPLKV